MKFRYYAIIACMAIIIALPIEAAVRTYTGSTVLEVMSKSKLLLKTEKLRA